MKNIKKTALRTFIYGSLLAALPACDLDEFNPSGSTADVVFSTQEGIESLVNRMYYNFRWKYYGREDPVLYMEGGTDLWYNAGKESYGSAMTQYSASLTASTGQFANVWNRVYDDINLCNSVINRISDVNFRTQEQKDFCEGQARWLRSYCYWWLVEFFGDVEMRTQETSAPEFYAYRTDLRTIYDEIIIPDAIIACEKLPVKPLDGLIGRYTRKAGYGLLARVALTRASYADGGQQQEFYEQAYEAANYLMSNKEQMDVKLYDTYDQIWRADNNKSNSEYLAIVSHSSNSILNPNPKNPNRLHNYYTPKMNGNLGISIKADSWEYYKEETKLMPTRYLLQLFEEGDMRYEAVFREVFYAQNEYEWVEGAADLNLYMKDYESIGNKKLSVGDTAFYFTRNSIPQMQKDKASYAVVDVDMLYKEDGSIRNATDEGGSTKIWYSFPRFTKYRVSDPDSDVKLCMAANSAVGYADVPIMRYAEVPLIAAEALIGLNRHSEAAQVINSEIRTSRVVRPGYETAMAVSEQDMNIDFILAERGRELCGEWLRWFDLKRTGNLVRYISTLKHNPDIGDNVKDYHNLRPIPQTFLDKLLNPDEFGQNEGY